jgi:hypothetical protein
MERKKEPLFLQLVELIRVVIAAQCPELLGLVGTKLRVIIPINLLVVALISLGTRTLFEA